MIEERARVLSNHPAGKNAHLLRLHAPSISGQTKPGQFVQVSCDPGKLLLRRPYSILDNRDGSVSLYVKRVGNGSNWLCERKQEEVLDLMGPLGNGFPLPPPGRHMLVGGGSGLASLGILCRLLAEAGGEVDVLMGFRTPEEIPGAVLDAFSRFCRSLTLVVEKGDFPVKGTAVDQMRQQNLEKFDEIYCCGPMGMLKALAPLLHGRGALVSLEARMGCGTGVCFGCTIPTRNGGKRVCLEGPVFCMDEVIWDEI